MKTPRELILERHQSAEAKLKAIRAEDLAASARSAAEASGERRPKLGLAVIAQRFWADTLWPWRRVWAGVAAGWLMVLALNLAGSDTSTTVSARPARSNPEVQAVLQQQEELLSQLLGLETPPHVSRARNLGPRSAYEASHGKAARLQALPGGFTPSRPERRHVAGLQCSYDLSRQDAGAPGGRRCARTATYSGLA